MTPISLGRIVSKRRVRIAAVTTLFLSWYLVGKCQTATPACPPSVTAWPTPPGNLVTAVMPTVIYDGTVVNLQVVGANLDAKSTVFLCSKTTNSTSANNAPSTKQGTSSTSSVLQSMVTAAPGSAGAYEVYISDTNNKVYDTDKTLTVTSSDDTRYVQCEGPATPGRATANLACSFVPLSHETTLEAYGKGVANRFIAAEVSVRNKNANLEYLLQDIRIGQPGLIFSSYDKKIPQAISSKEEQFSARAIIVRLTAAAAGVLTGVAGFAGNTILQEAANIFAGPAQAGLQTAIPDLSSAELTRLDDQAFSATSTVIPKNSNIVVVAFFPSDTLEPISKNTHWYNPHPNAYATFQGKDLKKFFENLTVSVAGAHVQETNPSEPTLKLFIPSSANTVQLLDLRAGLNPITIQGTNLDSVSQIQLSNQTDGKTVLPAKLVPLTGETTIDPSVAMLSVAGVPTADLGLYNIAFILSDGSVVKTGQSITVTPGSPTVSPTHGAVGASVTVNGSGFGNSQGTGTITFGGVTAKIISSWSDTSIVVQVPAGAPATANVVVTVSGMSTAPVPFTVP